MTDAILPPASDALPEDQQESAEDLVGSHSLSATASLLSTDWTVETIVSQVRKGSINLNPRFQRRNAWQPERQSYFIESLLLGLPVPQIILAEDKAKKGRFIVIDGKQRLSALSAFFGVKEVHSGEPLKLSGLKHLPELNGKTFEDIKNDKLQENVVAELENSPVRTAIIRNWGDERYLYEIFLRINTAVTPLSPQELRQALHPGPFTDFVDDVSVRSPALKKLLKLTKPDFRMRDVELVLRYFSYANFADAYRGNFKAFLDQSSDKLNRSFPAMYRALSDQESEMEHALTAAETIFGAENYMRKWTGDRYEKAVNRAVFDIMSFYFRNADVRGGALKEGEAVVAAFKRLCAEDGEFLKSIESTTKSLAANRERFGKWAAELTEIVGFEVHSPIAS